MKKFWMVSIVLINVFYLQAQKQNWQNLDLMKDSVFGISTEKAYSTILRNKKPNRVIVAIIDSGIDTTHEDLQSVIWTNTSDGSHGQSYVGYERGKEDITHLAVKKKDFYDSLSYTTVPEEYRAGYKEYRVLSQDYNSHVGNLEKFMMQLKEARSLLDRIIKNIGKEQPTLEDFKQYSSKDESEKNLLTLIIAHLPDYKSFKEFRFYELDHLLALGQYHMNHGLSLDSDDDGQLMTDSSNSDVANDALGLIERPSLTPNHGTHVAGIVGAVRDNGKGVNGVADCVSIMMLKVLSNVREMRDKDLASAIRYAVDHGAKVINMSFGKLYTFDKSTVDEAVKYAMQKDVLIVHGAGNYGMDLDADNSHFYPTRIYADGGIAGAWINVGASGFNDDSTLLASFSNFGKRTVDVFAPGVAIYSAIPHSKYTTWSGTSMASPLVAGLAALIREYFPKLTAVQVKEIIMSSVVKRDMLKEKCVSGGVVNAYQALQLAATYK